MRPRKMRRLRLESLESRVCLDATAMVKFGRLLVTDDTPADLVLTQVAADEWTVTDGGTPVGAGTFSGVTSQVSVTTSAADDAIEIDLGGFTAPKSILILAGRGENNILVHNGTINGALDIRSGADNDTLQLVGLTVNGVVNLQPGRGDNAVTILGSTLKGRVAVLTGDGDDTIVFGDGIDPVTFRSSVLVRDGGGPNDTLTVADLVTIKGSLQTYIVNSVTLAPSSVIEGSLYVTGGLNVPNALTLEGIVDRHVYFYGSGAEDTLIAAATSSVGGSLTAYLRGGADVLSTAGEIGNALYVDGNTGSDTIDVAGLIGRISKIYLGTGDDFLSFKGQVGIAPSTSASLFIDAGSGADAVGIFALAQVNGQLTVNMAGGDDDFALDDLSIVASAKVTGGSGIDTYYGTRPRAKVVDSLFELFDTIFPF